MLTLLKYAALAVRFLIRLFDPVFFSFGLWAAMSHFSYKVSYLESITMGNRDRANLVADTLEEFNLMADKPIVKQSGYRAVNIYDMPDWVDELGPAITFNPNTKLLGLALDLPFGCIIFLNKHLNSARLPQVTLHEYVHCFGYKHIDNTEDLMNADYEETVGLDNIKSWANKLERTMYGW